MPRFLQYLQANQCDTLHKKLNKNHMVIISIDAETNMIKFKKSIYDLKLSRKRASIDYTST